jgi:hypothetical protein
MQIACVWNKVESATGVQIGSFGVYCQTLPPVERRHLGLRLLPSARELVVAVACLCLARAQVACVSDNVYQFVKQHCIRTYVCKDTACLGCFVCLSVSGLQLDGFESESVDEESLGDLVSEPARLNYC